MGKLKLDGVEIKVKKCLIGDMMSISAVLGLVGPRSNHPCPLCDVAKENLLENGSSRTSDEAARRIQLKTKDTRLNLSHSEESLLHDCVVTVPLLHCFTGPASDVFQRMENDLKELCIAELTGREAFAVQKPLLHVPSDSDLLVAQNALQQFQLYQSSANKKISAKKCSPWCCLSHTTKTSFVECTTSGCLRWDHYYCFGFDSKKDIPKKYKCFSCSKGDTTGIESRLLDRFSRLDLALRDIDARESLPTHPQYVKWKGLCRNTKVIAQAYHGGTLNGNQTAAFLRNCTPFTSILREFQSIEGTRRMDIYESILFPLAGLHKLTKSSWLTDAEIDRVQVLANRLKGAVANQGIIPPTSKIHMIVCHLPKLARTFRTLGFFSEQGLEALHAEFNNELQYFKCFGKECRRILPVMRSLNRKHVILSRR